MGVGADALSTPERAPLSPDLRDAAYIAFLLSPHPALPAVDRARTPSLAFELEEREPKFSSTHP